MFNTYNTPYNIVNPYMSSYTMPSSMAQIQQMQNTTQNQNISNVNFFSGSIVHSYDEVRNFAIPASGSVMLLDLTNKRFYIKGMGDNGIPQIQAFAFDSVISDRPIETKLSEDNNLNLDKILELEERIGILEDVLKDKENITRKTTNVKKEG